MKELKIKDIFLSIDEEVMEVKRLLATEDLELDPFVEKTVGMYDGEKLVATGSTAGNTIRSICVNQDYRGQSAINKLMTYLIDYLYRIGKNHIFIYSKPNNGKSFEYLGFYPLIATDRVMLLDSKENGIHEFLDNIVPKGKMYKGSVIGDKVADTKQNKIVGSIVMNGNPFTLGHKYLVEKALESCDELYLFVVWEQKSLFPNAVRLRLIKEGLSEYKQVHVVKGEDYIISSATFPSYFLKDDDDTDVEHAKLDLLIFRDKIAPYLGITKRFVGDEKISMTTRKYNEQMKEILVGKGVDVVEIPRKEKSGKIISASYVRDYIRHGQWKEVKEIVPLTTYEFLQSEEAKPIIEKIKRSNTRH